MEHFGNFQWNPTFPVFFRCSKISNWNTTFLIFRFSPRIFKISFSSTKYFLFSTYGELALFWGLSTHRRHAVHPKWNSFKEVHPKRFWVALIVINPKNKRISIGCCIFYVFTNLNNSFSQKNYKFSNILQTTCFWDRYFQRKTNWYWKPSLGFHWLSNTESL